ncbi:hypothetical protein jhhlp_001146 [Lomentospora prolificans]|uniref:SUN domain-containing protein n=1 Tax=Lomentospora prolificans TaxID=41688 RepID=A0A2N3NHN0_9PEZI|nr:hypothetical protein jhhlp_001146 [Lomentospora prolificans]
MNVLWLASKHAILSFLVIWTHADCIYSQTLAKAPVYDAPAVCLSKTINYITHTLPQQCLRSTSVSPTVFLTAIHDLTATSQSPDAQEQAPLETGGLRSDHGHPILSFEEWKALMLQQHGQDARDIQGKRPPDMRRKRDHPIDPSLDTVGDEGEISFDFDVLSDYPEDSTEPSLQPQSNEEVVEVLYDDGKTQYYRSKDAGKTCKERFSYSSFDAGATVLKTSPGAKNAKAILLENKDSYMLFECQAEEKYAIVELSDDILVDTVVLANFEFFSSMVRHFRVRVSDRYPIKAEKWHLLGTFEARNSRDIQPFLVDNPQIWAKYVQVEFLTHYGNEYYCPLSLLRVHGTRMMESWKEAEPPVEEDDLSSPAGLVEHGTTTLSHESTNNTSRVESGPSAVCNRPLLLEMPSSTCPALPRTSLDADTADHDELKVDASWRQPANYASEVSYPPVLDQASSSGRAASPPAVEVPSTATHVSSANMSDEGYATIVHSEGSMSSHPAPPSQFKPSEGTVGQLKDRSTTATAAPSPPPIVQDSFFKTVTKRLQLLESNVTWTLKYVEEQSRYLQEAFLRIEERRLPKLEAFMDTLNHTVCTELDSLRQQYDQIWQSTIIALETQREQSQSEMVALSSRLNVLADEVVFQKRMSIAQSILLLSCLILIIFSRSMANNSTPTLWQPEVEASSRKPRLSSPSPQVPQASSYRGMYPIAVSQYSRLTPPIESEDNTCGDGNQRGVCAELYEQRHQILEGRENGNRSTDQAFRSSHSIRPWRDSSELKDIKDLAEQDQARIVVDSVTNVARPENRVRKPLPPLPE